MSGRGAGSPDVTHGSEDENEHWRAFNTPDPAYNAYAPSPHRNDGGAIEDSGVRAPSKRDTRRSVDLDDPPWTPSGATPNVAAMSNVEFCAYLETYGAPRSVVEHFQDQPQITGFVATNLWHRLGFNCFYEWLSQYGATVELIGILDTHLTLSG